MGVYTKTGDKGQTGLFTGERVDKDSLRVNAYGTVDEMNSALALARAFCVKEVVTEEILKLQKLNMLLMAELASLARDGYITASHVQTLEETIDRIEEALPPLNAFIVPGSSKGGAALDLARTMARRAERRTLALAKAEPVCPELLIALNRISDLCFMLMRLEEASL